MSLAAITYDKGDRIDDFIAEVVARLTAEGVRVRGLVQENFGDDPNCSTMILVDVASSDRFGISQDLGTQAHGCRLDPHGLASAGGQIDQALADEAELLILNKFGKAEAEQGAGLRSSVARALDLGLPVLTAVRPPYDEAWTDFHGGLATALPVDMEAVLAWCRKAVSGRSATRANATTPAD